MRYSPLPALALLAVIAFSGRAEAQEPRFDHWKHRKVFTSCTTCHVGAAVANRPLWPDPAGCGNCHDGEVEKKIEWTPPTVATASNLRFQHQDHAREFTHRMAGDTTLACVTCHSEKGAAWMDVARPIPAQCLDCHGITVAHREAPDTACATCHLPLVEAKALSRKRIADFPAPESHSAKSFMGPDGHGRLAQPVTAGDRTYPVAPSCATCHARDFCLECHVNAPEVAVIQALAPDPRATAIAAKLEAPAGHTNARWQAVHGKESRKDDATCSTCHTRESCAACHRGAVTVAQALPAAGPGRARGAQVERQQPDWHTRPFVARHGPVASADAQRCNACHARSECLDCHRPNPGAAGGYHPGGFLARHPAAAYNRQNDCSECHNPAAFCTDCHARSGFRSNAGLLRGQYHDAGGNFLLSHGRAARFNLESCVTCHSERDCLTCHSAQTRRFNPHGPGFDAERLKKKNPQTCSACHGRAIP